MLSLRGIVVSLRGIAVSLRSIVVSLRGIVVSLRTVAVSLRGIVVSLRGIAVSQYRLQLYEAILRCPESATIVFPVLKFFAFLLLNREFLIISRVAQNGTLTHCVIMNLVWRVLISGH